MQALTQAHRSCSCCSSWSSRSSSRPQRLSIRAQAPLSGSSSSPGASSNSTGTAALPAFTFDRPSGGGSRSFDLPRSSDSTLTFWAARSDVLRPSGGASRGAAFTAAAAAGDGVSGIDRPGGRGGRSDMPSGWDNPSTPVDPASARPGGRGGRDTGLSSSGTSGNAPVSIERPGGRGGRDAGLSSNDTAGTTPSIDRPGGRGGRGGPDGGDGGSSGGGGGSSGGGSGSGSGDEGGFSLGKGIGGVALYAGVIAAAWFGHQALFPAKQPEPEKPCCKGKGKAAKDSKGKK